MPMKHETPSSKPPKSSSTRANSDLVVRQASGTHSNRLPSPTDSSRGGSEAQSASQRSSPSPIPPSRRSDPAQRPARATDLIGRHRTSPVPATNIDNYLAHRKKAFIKVFMAKVEDWLDDNVCPRDEAYEHDGDYQQASKSSRSGGTQRRAAKQRPVAGQKRQLKGRDQEDDDASENDENNDRNRNKKRTKTDEDDDRRKFACPFYKHDPARYKSHRTCVGPGWHEIHRMKEHIYRKHRVFTCTRCFEAFKSDGQLQDHLRAVVACSVRDKKTRKLDPSAGLDQDTEKHLRARATSKKDGVDKWYEVYYILFPGTQDVDNPPSPWYDETAGDSNSEALKRQYVKFLRREMPNMIQRELESELDRHFEGFEEGIMNRLVGWIRASSARCADIFENILSPSQAAALGDPETARSGSRASSPAALETDLTVGDGASVLEGMEPWTFGYPDFDWRTFPSFDQYNMPQSFPSSDDQCLTDPDSAYGTGSTEDPLGARQNYM
ncbi:hypothetical protein CSAL01_01563 [Colletotrichum salicis]|uniref:C2H2-type domain-containing protein n=1 Tax=Colletotrichum salicis TaxID=1209931 RepID=A0A135SHV9_9PEZI|nr:hypothetical protein CSAL01_01563 [Colletotrichum salicis]